jgi:hypothetical protein
MKNYTPAGEGSPVVPRYNYATGEYMRPSYYGNDRHLHGLDAEINNRNTRMGRKGYAPVPNYMVGNGNSPMHRGGNNLFPSPQQGFQYLTSGGYPPPSAMPQNSNVYPAMFNHQTGQRIDPQSGGLVPYAPKVDKHSSSTLLDSPSFSGVPSYLGGHNLPFRVVDGKGGYQYKQFSDGSIQILKSPQGGSGTMVTKSSQYWQAITNEIGQYPTISTGNQRADALLQQGRQFAQSEQGQSILTALFDRFISGQGLKQDELELQRLQAQQQSQAIRQSMQPSFFDKAKPYLLSLGIIGAFTGIAIAVTSPKKKRRK